MKSSCFHMNYSQLKDWDRWVRMETNRYMPVWYPSTPSLFQSHRALPHRRRYHTAYSHPHSPLINWRRWKFWWLLRSVVNFSLQMKMLSHWLNATSTSDSKARRFKRITKCSEFKISTPSFSSMLNVRSEMVSDVFLTFMLLPNQQRFFISSPSLNYDWPNISTNVTIIKFCTSVFNNWLIDEQTHNIDMCTTGGCMQWCPLLRILGIYVRTVPQQ